jgi:outer membrane immunogenic protein
MGNVMRDYAKLAVIGLAVSGAMGLSGAAHAADVYQHGGSLKDEPAPIVTPLWTGLYVGGSVGYGWGDISNTFDIGSDDGPDKQSDSPDSFLYGGFVGFNIQSGNIVFGAELGLNVTDFDASTFDDTVTNHIDRYYTAVGRLGYAYGDWLLYGFGGAAWASVKTGELQTFVHHDEASQMGWTAGAGIERAFSDRFSVRLEYSHVDLGSATVLKDDPDKVDVNFDTVKIGAVFKLTDDHPLEALK